MSEFFFLVMVIGTNLSTVVVKHVGDRKLRVDVMAKEGFKAGSQLFRALDGGL